jgi:hypothetical protein
MVAFRVEFGFIEVEHILGTSTDAQFAAFAAIWMHDNIAFGHHATLPEDSHDGSPEGILGARQFLSLA